MADDLPNAGSHEGGCLCGAVRYRVTAQPAHTTVCHCTFCQRLTGSAFLVEPIFREADVAFSGATPKVHARRSEGSGKQVFVHFCGACGTTLGLKFERFPGVVGVAGGTFDDPSWFDRGPGRSRHIFTRFAQAGVVLPAGVDTYADHFYAADGSANTPVVHARPWVVER